MFGWRSKNEIKVTSLQMFVREVSKIRAAWLEDPADELWFRGEDEKHHDTTLIPELYRSKKTLDEVLEKEEQLFEEFKRCGVQYSDFDPDDEWNWYFMMQHHGGPTRLLDWSDGSLMAVHFAIRSKTTADELKTGAVVYLLDPHWLIDFIDEQEEIKEHRRIWDDKPKTKLIPEGEREEEYEQLWLPGDEDVFREDPLPTHPFLLRTEQITRRVAAQRSRFMVFGTDREYLRKLLRSKDAKIREIRIPAECIPKMQIDLRDCGITESVIFPDLDGMGREIKQLWQQFKAR
ncbi:MAG: FRG domain-containing protein [Bryobacteraceae bacterium]|jgi:hypothetical protein